jgi:hypothetical protein
VQLKILVGVLVGVVAAGTGCAGGGGAHKASAEAKTFRGGGFSFTYPASWHELTPGPELGGITYRAGVGPPGPRHEAVSVTVQPVGVRLEGRDLAITAQNLTRYESLAVIAVETPVSLMGGELSAPKRVSAAGLPGFRFEVSHMGLRGGGHVDAHITQLFKGSTTYIVSCQYTARGAAELQRACDQVLGSFRVATRGATAAAGRVLLRDDFANERSGWVGRDRNGSEKYASGRYRIDVDKQKHGHTVSHDLGRPAVALRVDALIRQSSGGRRDGYGVLCLSGSSRAGYEFLIGPYQGFLEDNVYIIKIAPHQEPDALFFDNNDAVKPRGSVNTIRAECAAASGATPARMTLYTNGKLVAHASDLGGYARFDRIGLNAWSDKGGTSVLFDDVVVRELKGGRQGSPSG